MEDNFDIPSRILKYRERFLTTGCSKLDNVLKGGFPCRGITQIYGAAGVGKTQVALQLCLTVQLPITNGGLESGAIYICTEAAFPIKRLQQLMEKFHVAKKYGANGDRVFIQHVSTIDELESCLLQKVPILMAAQKIGLIIIDSIAAPYRVEDWSNQSVSRAKSLRIIGQQLHNLSKNKDVCVMCINQVSGIIENNVYNEQPCLGMTWSSLVTNSIYLNREGSLRYCRTVLSSCIPYGTYQFQIHESGIKGV